MRQIVALLLPALAWADNSVPGDRAHSWQESCAARLQQARKVAMAMDGRFERGKVETFVNEDVLPLQEHVRYRLEWPPDDRIEYGFWVDVGPADEPADHDGWYEIRRQPFPMGPRMRRARILNKRFAEVSQKLGNLSIGQKQRIQALWEAAADDCLRMQ